MSSMNLGYRQEGQDVKYINKVNLSSQAKKIKELKRCLSENDCCFINNRSIDMTITQDVKIDSASFLTLHSQSFPSDPLSQQDLDEVRNKENHNENNLTDIHRSVGFHSSNQPSLESSCDNDDFSCLSSKSATVTGDQMCNNESNSSNLSWISRSLCGIDSSSALESIDDETSFHSALCMTNCSLRETINNDSLPSVAVENSKLEERPSICLGCSRVMHNCNCVDNVECVYTERPRISCSKRRSNRRTKSPVLTNYNETEQAIKTFLEAKVMWCNSWSEWFPEEDEEKLDIDIRCPAKTLRKKAMDLKTRRRRLERMQMNLTPFSYLDEELNQGAINMDKYKQSKWSRSRSDVSSKLVKIPSRSIHKSVPQMNIHWDTIYCGGEQVHDKVNTLSLDHTIEEEDKCYDSDPSEILFRLHQSSKLKPLKGLRMLSAGSKFELEESELNIPTFFEKMHGLMNSKKTLVWHGNNDNTQVAVKAWLEPGSQLQSILIQPKFMWQQTLGTNKRTDERRVLNTRILHSVDLLDITKIVATEAIDRMKYPFVKCSCSFIVQSFAKEMVFEAVSETERDDIVDGLKMTVARLGSKILVGDGQVLNEFFTPIGASVPGNVPTFVSEGNFATTVVEN